jgi:hypothetical protein
VSGSDLPQWLCAEAHQLEVVFAVLHLLDEGVHVGLVLGIFSSISSTAWLTPPYSGPRNAVTPPEIEVAHGATTDAQGQPGRGASGRLRAMAGR